jgi:peptidyl-prolyl cis-trans isomerase C
MTATIRHRIFAGAGAAVAVALASLALLVAAPQSQAQTQPAPSAQAAPAVPPATPAQPGGGIVASVNGDPITEDDLNVAYMEFADQLANFSIDQRRDVTIDLLIHIKLLARAAEAQGIDKDPTVAEQLKLVHDRALYNEYLDRLFATEVTEDKAHALFDQQQKNAPMTYEYHVAHILVPTKDEASQLIAKLDAGGDFGQLAKDNSIDTGSAAMGGDLGFIAAGDTVKEFETAAFALDVGKYTEQPVESQFGFHVIKLIEKRVAPPKTFDDEAQNLQDTLAENAFQKTIDDLSAKATIYKAPPPGPQPATPAPAGGAAPGAPAAPAAPAAGK